MDLSSSQTNKRFFVSYRRRAPLDGELAGILVERLEHAGHEVFIDLRMPIGTRWIDEIDQRIHWCDYLVVLLSEDSIHSEMVQGEVRRAHQRFEQEGKPAILPVRVDYDGPLGYELDSYLAPVQQSHWRGAETTERLISEILDAVSTRVTRGKPDDAAQPEPAVEEQRPVPSKDPRILRAPGGTLRSNDPFYIERAEDQRIQMTASYPGETLVIKGARQMGKSSLLVRYLQACQQAGKQIAYIDFQSFSETDLADYNSLLHQLAGSLLRALGLPAEQNTTADDQLSFSYFIEDVILKRLSAPIAFAFDEVDRILGRPYQHDFFSMLRMWHNNRAQPNSAWEDVDLALVISTEPYLLIDTANQSPFNVSVPVTLHGFSRKAVERLNTAYGAVLNQEQCDAIFALLAGHPYLTRLALYYRVGPPQMPIGDLIKQAASSDGPFGDHLKALLLKLKSQPGLLDSLHQAIKQGTLPNETTYYRLRGAGLVIRNDGPIHASNELYARFFSEIR